MLPCSKASLLNFFMQEPCMSFEATQKTCRDQCVKPKDFAIFELVVGAAGKPTFGYDRTMIRLYSD